MLGNWKLAETAPCNLPEKVATGFCNVVAELCGATYIPVLYCGEQLVHGTNYMLICKQTLITQSPEEHIVKLILHQPLPTDTEQTWSFLSCETLC